MAYTWGNVCTCIFMANHWSEKDDESNMDVSRFCFSIILSLWIHFKRLFLPFKSLAVDAVGMMVGIWIEAECLVLRKWCEILKWSKHWKF